MKRFKTKKSLFQATALVFLLGSNLKGQEIEHLSNMQKQVIEAKTIRNDELADSIAKVYIETHLLKLDEKELFTRENLTFISEHLGKVDDPAFKLFILNPEKINSILGSDKAEIAIRKSISAAYIPKNFITISMSDWDTLERKISDKFGPIGLEELYGKRMLYSYEKRNWSGFGKYYQLYFEKALKRPQFNINAISWLVFENVNDPIVLTFACDEVMKYAIEEWYQADFAAWDTYANLLFKSGEKKMAIEWEKKAVKASNNDAVFIETLEKMKKNMPTWGLNSN